MSDSNNYYRRRIEEELAAAERSTSPGTARIHREMASRYRDLLNQQSVAMNDDAELAQPVGGPIAQPGIVHA